MLKNQLEGSKNGASLLEISNIANSLGFETKGVMLNIDSLSQQNMPCIVHWRQKHFVVIYKITKTEVRLSDPAPGILINYTIDEFKQNWISKDEQSDLGHALLFKPTPLLKKLKKKENKKKWLFLKEMYFIPFKAFYGLIIIGMLIGLFLSFLTPFITKSIVDIGIEEKDITFVNLMLMAQVVTAISTTILGILRSWIFLHMGWRMNFNAVSKFLAKIIKLPISFFDSSQVGDLMQRINDHGTLKMFVSASTFTMFFSFANLIMFGGILAYYNLTIFFIFLFSSILYVIWVRSFMEKRKTYDYKLFDKNAAIQNKLFQIFSGIKDIKLNNYEGQSQKQWQDIQTETFKVNSQQMVINQYQQVGSFVIDMSKNIMISYITARLVINGEMTLGMMLSVQYILGQLNVPVLQFIGFNNSLQDARISIDRINEVYDRTDEDTSENSNSEAIIGDIQFNDVTFRYSQNNRTPILEKLNIVIPIGKRTAIVGASGSGKSTILRLLLKFYIQNEGSIMINGLPLTDIEASRWRSSCASVLQDGFVFTDTFLKNIGFGDENIDLIQAEYAAKLANIHDHIVSLPEGYFTIVGTEVNSLSQGQRQRLLIARAMYKKADYLLLDEPTTSLDARNEKLIMANIKNHYVNRTLVVVAHRLSTIADFDNIIVMEKGKLAESGNHKQLIANNGLYAQMVRDYDES